jgi:DNA-binding LytR/AlgR family response regulator
MKVFIAEDEPPARERLVEALGRVAPQAQVLAHADSVNATAQWLASHPAPDLLLLDIQLADGLSLELFRGQDWGVPVIFTTAYDRFALQAFQALAVDYLLKPISDAALAQALAKTAKLRPMPTAEVGAWFQRGGAGPAAWRQRLFGRKAGHTLHVLAVADLAYLVSLDKLGFAVMRDGTRYQLDATLSDLERELDPACFFRINRQMLVAAWAVQQVSPAGKGRLSLRLGTAGAADAQVSQERAAAFKTWLQAAPL